MKTRISKAYKSVSLLLILSLFSICSFGQILEWSKVENVRDLNSGDFVQTDDENNVYVGASRLTSDMYVIKYDKNGNELLVVQDEDASKLKGMQIGNDGKIYMIGYMDIGGYYAGILKVYNPDGSLHYQQTHQLNNLDVFFEDIYVDIDGNAYVTGLAYDNIITQTIIVKYLIDGSPQWAQTYMPDANIHYGASNITVEEGSATTFVAGRAHNTISSKEEAFLIQLAPNGIIDHEYFSNFADINFASPTCLIVDASGNAYMGGIKQEGLIYTGFLITVNNGAEQWKKVIESTSGQSMIYDATFNATGNIIICGHNDSPQGGAVAIGYSPTGTELFLYRYDGVISGEDMFLSMVNKNQHTYLTGTTPGIGTDYNIQTVCVDEGGQFVWEAIYNGFNNGFDQGRGIAVDGEENVIVTGNTNTSGGNYCVTLKYANPLSIPDLSTAKKIAIDVYPNPANTSIRFIVEVETDKPSYLIYNSSGQEVMRNYFSATSENEIPVSKLQQGIYYIQIIDGKKQYNAKFVKN